jgi:subtilisin family serine protease
MLIFTFIRFVQTPGKIMLILAVLLSFSSGRIHAEAPEKLKPSPVDIICLAAAEGKLVLEQTTPEELKALLGPPVNEQVKKWEGNEYLIFDYPNVQVAFSKTSDDPLLFTFAEVAINGRGFDISELSKCIVRDEEDLKKFDAWGGLWNAPVGVSLVTLDLRGHKKLLEEMRFDSRTKWPEPNKMPDGFDPARLLEDGKNPGLGIRGLHKQGIDGRGVAIAILDQVLLKDHVEYADSIVRYEEIDIHRDMNPQMHGPPIVSIAVGKNCGVAPRASVFYYAMRMTSMPDNNIYCDIIDKIIQHNKNTGSSEKIRVINISTGMFHSQANFARWKETLRKADRYGILVVTCDPDFLRYGTLSLISEKSPDDPFSYRRDSDYPSYVLLVPTNRTTASHFGPQVYTYWTNGDMSWAAPYLAGLAALAFQVNPEIEPDRIVELWLETAVKTDAGPIVNPVGFIEAVQKDKAK